MPSTHQPWNPRATIYSSDEPGRLALVRVTSTFSKCRLNESTISLNCAPMKSLATIAPPGLSMVAATVRAVSISSRERASSRAAIPVSFGVLTTDTIEQALERAGTKAGNKGYDAAIAAIELATLYKALAAKPKKGK